MHLHPLRTGTALPHSAPLESVRCRFLRRPDARLRPGVQIRRRIDRRASSFAVDRPTADDGELSEPPGRTWQTPMFPNMARRPIAAEVKRRDFHQSFSMAATCGFMEKYVGITGKRLCQVLTGGDVVAVVRSCHTSAPTTCRPMRERWSCSRVVRGRPL
jgi:hypothetical protein